MPNVAGREEREQIQGQGKDAWVQPVYHQNCYVLPLEVVQLCPCAAPAIIENSGRPNFLSTLEAHYY